MNDLEYPKVKSNFSPPLGDGGFFHFTFAEVAPTFDEIIEFVQSADLEEEHPAVIFIREILAELNFDTAISGGYLVKDIEELNAKQGMIRIDGQELNLGRQVCGYIKESTHAALFLCTAGEDFTRMTNQLNEQGDIMEAYILDAIGSLTVEKAMDKIQENLRDSFLSKQLKISNRYSPGYCNWPLADQKTLFNLIGENKTGITLSDSCLMTPRKSVSGIIGIGKHLKHHEYGCKICSNATCIYRKILNE
ncbi:MAG: vitamin B12 dependent-methionine synthase activation domain-containing protein [Paludibacter sp.]|nr:vitamin B12 dependent-methionine synthase activation domain-containing protein [Paludibacter sp.]